MDFILRFLKKLWKKTADERQDIFDDAKEIVDEAFEEAVGRGEELGKEAIADLRDKLKE